jgi:tetratricopeptide (TPR) repeat protein
MTTNVVNNIADFAELWFPLYMDFLLDLPIVDPDHEQRRFVEQYRRHFIQNPGALELIKEFEENYMPHGAIYYYSCDGFIYRLVNRALRRQAMDAILDFRFLLFDIRNQLQSAHKDFLDKNTKVGMLKTFFRGQRMSRTELKELQEKHRDGTLITTNSYFSTSENIDVARIFAGKPEPAKEIVSILFQITAEIKDPAIQQRKPFSRISKYSNFGAAESEVLFSIGSFFKIDKIYEESPSFLIIELTFVDDDDEKQDVIGDFRALRTCSSEAKIIKIGHLLANNSHQGIPQAKIFYELIKTSNFSETLGVACTAGLGWLAYKERNETLAIEQQQIALRLYEQLPKDEGESLTQLYITSYNCIGASFRLMKKYRQALKYYRKAEELLLKVPIDKYAMYEGYRNITSINIASIQKLLGEIDQAWDTYKKLLAYEMSSSTRFHGHTYLTIAQAGIHEAKILHNEDETERCSQSWKAFLDISLTNMSSNYRRSIISGVLLIGFEYMDNEQRRTMAIDYFQKVINISLRYVKINRDDHLIVLKCLNQMARLYTKKRNYDQSINHALDALNMCHENELADIAECYESMALNYEQQLLDQKDDLTPDDICRMIVDNPFSFTINNTETIPGVILTFKRNEFAFGQYTTKTMNPNVLQEPDLKRRLAYCYLKLAALAQTQGYKREEQAKIDNDDLLEKKAREYTQTAHKLLKKVAELLKDDLQVQKICTNNIIYLNEGFDSIIHIYQEDLNNHQLMQQENNPCIGEDAFSYIAHLYSRKKEVDKENQWYNSAVQYFETHHHICEHTIMCFRKLVHFYEKHKKFVGVIDTLRRLADHLLKYSPQSFLRTSIEPIVTTIVQHFNEKGDNERVILILHNLIELILTEPTDDIARIDEQFKKLIVRCMDDAPIVNQAYGSYLEVLLRHKPLPSDSYIRAVEPAFRQAFAIHHACGNHRQSIETYQRFIELYIKSTNNRQEIEAAFKRLALEFETSKQVDIALDMYSYLGKFIVKYKRTDDNMLAGFVIVRCKLLKLSAGAVFNENTLHMFIQLMIFYHNSVEPQFVFSEYFQSRYANVDRRSSSGTYLDLLEFCFQYRSELYEDHMKANITALINRPAELIAFVTTNRVNYKALILNISERYGNRSAADCPLKQFSSSFETIVTDWLSSIENDRTIYWTRLLHCLLELQSVDDECLAICYTKMGDTKSAASLFNSDVYGEPALRFNPNACRRYLRYVYPQASPEERISLETRYQKHFFIECDSFSGQMTYAVLPIE